MAVLPWGPGEEKMQDDARATRRRYIKRPAIAAHGKTDGCGGCDGAPRHIPRCRARFERIWAKEEPKMHPKAPPVTATEPQGEDGEEAAAPPGEANAGDAGASSSTLPPRPEPAASSSTGTDVGR